MAGVGGAPPKPSPVRVSLRTARSRPKPLDARGQGFGLAFATDVHEGHLGRVVEKVIVQSVTLIHA